eukprot:TRINITY_DN5483_c0_g3_i1.p1 TRINITY_DN5483_c0_g3~~TRINITY_DN5483_c0_g3_i1.p1  ORF type:complete len:427 (+),score=94.81 TRINITY_DN5483_c0_g3_i1:81-1361(+)
MAAVCDDGTIKEGDWGLIHLMDDRVFSVCFKKNELFKSAKIPGVKEINLGEVVGMGWNQSIIYDTDKKKLVKDLKGENEEAKAAMLIVGGDDNRGLLDTNTAQQANTEELLALKKGGGGNDAVKVLVNSSATFAGKTVYSQEKYIKKKQKKWSFSMRPRRATLANSLELYHVKKPEKLMNLRVDGIAQILHQANVHAHSKTLIMESCAGLISAGVVERQGGFGKIYNIVGTQGLGAPTSPVFDWMHLNAAAEKCLVNVELTRDVMTEVTSPMEIEENAKPMSGYRVMQSLHVSVKEIVAGGGLDSVIIVSQHDAAEVFEQFRPLMGGRCSFAIHSKYLMPLSELASALRADLSAVNVQLNETFWREYQVLPNRTHPFVNMNSAGGFILSGSIVKNNHPRSFWSATATATTAKECTDSEPPAKKQKN